LGRWAEIAAGFSINDTLSTGGILTRRFGRNHLSKAVNLLDRQPSIAASCGAP
jgi:hypothetical protein